MKIEEMVQEKILSNVFAKYPIGKDFFENIRLSNINTRLTLEAALSEVDEECLKDFELKKEEIIEEFICFLQRFETNDSEIKKINSLTILGGRNKFGEKEQGIKIKLNVGDVVSIVGPTGSGKSRLLEDIECLAQGDTPTERTILVDDINVTDEVRFELGGKLVAQLSQNMNFVMDLTVKEFLMMHARSRLKSNTEEIIEKCYNKANYLAGEKFELTTKITQLSGGQSRALMIADTAYISESPIVLIDEIENAGVNRKKAIELLAKKEKIVLISTHDPILALSADLRIVISNGGIDKVIQTSKEEKESLIIISKLDDTLQNIREDLRYGKQINMANN